MGETGRAEFGRDEADSVRRAEGGTGRPRVVKANPRVIMTAGRQEAFLSELAMTCNASASARAVGVLENTVFTFRRRNADFRAAWDVALAEGYIRLELAMLERALIGTEKLLVSGGETRTVREIDPRTAIRLLAMHRDRVEKERARSDAAARAAMHGAEAMADARILLVERLAEMGERLRDPE